MAIITPLSSLPANGVTPAGTLTLSNPQGQLTVYLSGTGAASAALKLITMLPTGDWAYLEGGQLNVVANASDDRAGYLPFDNRASATKYHAVKVSGSSSCVVDLSALVDVATSTALVAHAAQHLSGGGDDLLGSPGTVGDVTPGAFCGTFGPDSTHQNTVPNKNGDTFALLALAQTFSAIKTFSAAPVFSGGLTASGAVANDWSGSTGAFKTSTGAVTIGGGANAIGITSSGAAITITAGAASTWSTSAGALNIDGFSGVNLKKGGSLVADVGATSATALTLAAGATLGGAAGAGAVSLGNLTGDCTFPTGAMSWTGAANKAVNFTANTAAINFTAGAASQYKVGTAGALTLDGFDGVIIKKNTATVMDVGASSATKVTLAANKDLVCAAGTTAVDMSLGTGIFKTTTGANTFGGSSNTFAADIAMATFKVTGLGAASAAGDALRYEQGGLLVSASNTGVIGVGTKYGSPIGGGAVNAAQTVLGVVTRAGVLRSLAATLGTAPGGADTVDFTVQKSSDQGSSWSDTTLTCQISAAGKTATDTTHFPAVAKYDWLAIKYVSSAATAAAPAVSFEIL